MYFELEAGEWPNISGGGPSLGSIRKEIRENLNCTWEISKFQIHRVQNNDNREAELPEE